MPTIQAFLTVILCGFVWLTIILGLALAGGGYEPGTWTPKPGL